MIINSMSTIIGNYIISNCSIDESNKEKVIYALKAVLR